MMPKMPKSEPKPPPTKAEDGKFYNEKDKEVNPKGERLYGLGQTGWTKSGGCPSGEQKAVPPPVARSSAWGGLFHAYVVQPCRATFVKLSDDSSRATKS